MSRGKYPVFLLICWAYTVAWILLWVHLFMVWHSAGAYYRWGLVLVLGVSSPSVPDLFRSYESYRQEQERLYGTRAARE